MGEQELTKTMLDGLCSACRLETGSQAMVLGGRHLGAMVWVT